MTRRSTLRLAAAVVVAAVAVPSAAQAVRSGPVTASAAASRTVTLKGIAFTPKTLRIKRGQTVTWVWKDGSIPHDVKSSTFKSSKIKTSGTYKVKFPKKGTFAYVCTIHPNMKAKIVVR